MSKRIMLLTSSSNVSGPIKGVFQLIENYDRMEIESSLYDFQYSANKENFLTKAAGEKKIPVKLLVKYNQTYFSQILQVVDEIRKNRFELIQTHGFLPTFLGFFAKMSCNVKWICFMHGQTNENIKVRFYNLIDNILQLFANRTVLVSEAQRRIVFGGKNIKRVKVLHNAVDLKNPMPTSLNARSVQEIFSLPENDKIIVAVGRLSPEKGMDILLDAFALLTNQNKNIHLIVVGDGQERQSLELQTLKLGLTGKVHFVGYSNTPGDYVSGADLLVLPSRSEGIPNVLLEAMAMGKPVVATKVGGVSEIIEDGISGRLVQPEQPELLAQALEEILNDKTLYQHLVVEGKRRVSEAFSIQKRVSKLESLYREVLSTNG